MEGRNSIDDGNGCREGLRCSTMLPLLARAIVLPDSQDNRDEVNRLSGTARTNAESRARRGDASTSSPALWSALFDLPGCLVVSLAPTLAACQALRTDQIRA